MDTDDWQLLSDYATRNSEEAFHALVDRYAGVGALVAAAGTATVIVNAVNASTEDIVGKNVKTNLGG